MKPVLVSQRVERVLKYAETRDALDQRWSTFLIGCGLLPVPVPNHAKAATLLAECVDAAGFLLTGGGDIAEVGGEDTERDLAEAALLGWCLAKDRPVFGVCRGMQFLLAHFAVEMKDVPGHVATMHPLLDNGRSVNSYHRWAARRLPPDLQTLAKTEDGVVEAFSHNIQPVAGIMWHPERASQFDERDTRMVRNFFDNRFLRVE